MSYNVNRKGKLNIQANGGRVDIVFDVEDDQDVDGFTISVDPVGAVDIALALEEQARKAYSQQKEVAS